MALLLLERMRGNPVGDWTLPDVEKVCRMHGLQCQPPTGGGSHYKISHPGSPMILTIPFRRPIKAVYIRKLLAFVDAYGEPI
jgi:hypothetical protein